MKIEIKDVDYIYNEGMPNEVYALKDINLEINSKESIGLISSRLFAKSGSKRTGYGIYKRTF